MSDWRRLERHLFDPITCSDITQPSAVESPYGVAAAKYASYAAGPAAVSSTSAHRKGLRSNTVSASGSMPLWGQMPGQRMRAYGSLFVPNSIMVGNAQTVYGGFAVFANDGSAGRDYVFAGLSCGPSFSNPQWLLAHMQGASLVATYQSIAAGGITLPARVTGLTATPSGSGGTFAAGTYYYEVVAYDAAGNGAPSAEVSATVVANGEVSLSWSAASGAVVYGIYRSTTSRGEAAGNELLAYTSAPTTSFTDTGAATGGRQTDPTSGITILPTASGNSTFSLPFKVAVDGNVVSMWTPSGVLSQDTTGDQSVLSNWWGARFITPGSSSPISTLLLNGEDWQWLDPSYTRPNAVYDNTDRMTGFTPIVEFGSPDGSDYYLANGATPTWDPDDVLYSANSMVQADNNLTSDIIVYRPAAPLNLSSAGQCLALSCKPMAPPALQYHIDSLGSAIQWGDSAIPLAGAGSTFSVGSASSGGEAGGGTSGGQCDLQLNDGTWASVFFTAIKSGALQNCRWVGSGSGTINAGNRVAQHNGAMQDSGTLNLMLAASQAEFHAGNYLLLSALPSGLCGWQTITWLLGGRLGPEGRFMGSATASTLQSIGYIQINWGGSKLPWSSANDTGGIFYDGPQDPTPRSIKWDTLATFQNALTPGQGATVVFTQDDSHDSDWYVIARRLETPRPGFPNGMRQTFHTIQNNLDGHSHVTSLQVQKMCASGHEICLHINNKRHHGAPSAGGDGPLPHYEIITPGGTKADVAAQMAALAGLGIEGPYSHAYPYGDVSAAVIDALASNGVACSRTTNGGGPRPVTTGSGPSTEVIGFSLNDFTQRFCTSPHGQLYMLPGQPQRRDINSGDYLGHRLVERAIVEACMQGMVIVIWDHEMYPASVQLAGAIAVGAKIIPVADVTGNPADAGSCQIAGMTVKYAGVKPTGPGNQGNLTGCSGVTGAVTPPATVTFPSNYGGSWNGDQMEEVLQFISDLKTGGNVSGRNQAGANGLSGTATVPQLQVMTLQQAITGTIQPPAVPEAWGISV